MTRIDSNLVSAFVGALVGGAASLVGSIFVGRRELTRRTRIHIFNEIIPILQEELANLPEQSEVEIPFFSISELKNRMGILLDGMSYGRDKLDKEMDSLFRATVIAGYRDARKVRPLKELLREQKDLFRAYQACLYNEYPGERPTVQVPLGVSREEYDRLQDSDPLIEEWSASRDQWKNKVKSYYKSFYDIDPLLIDQVDALQRFLARRIR